MFMVGSKKQAVFLVVSAGYIFIMIFIAHRSAAKVPFFTFLLDTSRSSTKDKKGTGAIQRVSEEQEIELKIKTLFNKLDQSIPHINFTHMNFSTSAGMSSATILNHKDRYCIGDHVTVQLDMYDYLGERKTYGGDFLRARIYSPDSTAGATGTIEDFNNGTYLVHFILFWPGRVKVSLLLIHPSEGVSALWRARNQGYEKVHFRGVYTSTPKDVVTKCGFYIHTTKELCKYQDHRDHQYFFCIKPQNVSCFAFASLSSYNSQHSYLSPLETSLLDRSNIGIEISKNFEDITVNQCNKSLTPTKKRCRIGMRSSVPSGYFYQNRWFPSFCEMLKFKPQNQTSACLQEKMIHLLGDSTLRQWLYHFPKLVQSLKFFDLHGVGAHKTQLALDMKRNIRIKWKKHGYPYVTREEYTVKDDAYLARQIDQLAGGNYTVVVITIGQHFRPFPIEVFIRRAINVRRSLERLTLRSPDTKVIIKSENIREMDLDQERFSDFHGYVQYLVMNEIFQDLNVGIIDAWDMTTALAAANVHPPHNIISNQIDMFFTYIC